MRKINNAGVYPTEGVSSVDEGTFGRALNINTLGPFRTCRAFVPAMARRGYGRVINLSSGGGSFGRGVGPVAYGASKAALNALTVKVAEAARGDVKADAMCPGWARTGMGRGRPRSPEQAADTLLWLATLPPEGPNGGFFHNRRPIPW